MVDARLKKVERVQTTLQTLGLIVAVAGTVFGHNGNNPSIADRIQTFYNSSLAPRPAMPPTRSSNFDQFNA